jgi:beta-N-acetylhexosaminidase
VNDYGPLMLSLEGTKLGLFESNNCDSWNLVNGYLLFKKNFISATQITNLINSVQEKRRQLSLPPALIAVDHEGGSVQRFQDEYFTKIPSASLIGELFIHDPLKAEDLMKSIALISSAELGSCGVNLLLGPVLDLSNKEKPNSRTYSANPLHLIQIVTSLLTELKLHGFQTIGKHFPGLGTTLVDTHTNTAEMNLTFEELNALHLPPFQSLINAKLLTGVMLAHGTYPLIDSNPIPGSTFWLQQVLRNRLAFDGLIMTDCLHMLAAQTIGKNNSSRILNCMQAGCDIVLLTHIFNAMKNIITKLQSYPAFLEINREDNHKRIVEVFNKTKPLEYYLNLRESKAYHDARQYVVRVFEDKTTVRVSLTIKPQPEDIYTIGKLRLKKILIFIVKYFLKYPWIREGLYRSYYFLLRYSNKAKKKKD